MCLNLVKAAEKRPRETLLRTEFCNAMTYLNQGVQNYPSTLFLQLSPSNMSCWCVEGRR